MRLDIDGNYIWTGDKITMSSVQSGKLHITANRFNYNQWIAVWGDDRNTNNDIYGQNIQLDGSLGPIPDILQADFSADETEVCSGDLVNFTDESGGDIISWGLVFLKEETRLHQRFRTQALPMIHPALIMYNL